jgi:hypothetical protein
MTEPQWRRNLRTAANAGHMSGLQTVPVKVEDLDNMVAASEPEPFVITVKDLDAMSEAIDRADGAFSSIEELANREQDAKTVHLRTIIDALAGGKSVVVR